MASNKDYLKLLLDATGVDVADKPGMADQLTALRAALKESPELRHMVKTDPGLTQAAKGIGLAGLGRVGGGALKWLGRLGTGAGWVFMALGLADMLGVNPFRGDDDSDATGDMDKQRLLANAMLLARTERKEQRSELMQLARDMTEQSAERHKYSLMQDMLDQRRQEARLTRMAGAQEADMAFASEMLSGWTAKQQAATADPLAQLGLL
jgi:hypothetical protein